MPATAQAEKSIAINDWGFIWKYKRYARESQNTTANQIILKILTWGGGPSWLRHLRWIGRLLVQTSLGNLPGLGNQTLYRVPLPLG